MGVEGFTGHNSLFPFGGQIVEELTGELAGRTLTKGGIHFALDEPFPTPSSAASSGGRSS